MSLYYAGIGSRQTPDNILEVMTSVASALEKLGFILRSGGAGGADLAFELGVQDVANKEIYLPWPGFNSEERFKLLGNRALHGKIHNIHPAVQKQAQQMAAKYHPAWHRCSQGAKKLHARNCHQALGRDLKTPSAFCVCWTKNGQASGGTGQALRIFKDRNIPIYNLYWDEDKQNLKNIILAMNELNKKLPKEKP